MFNIIQYMKYLTIFVLIITIFCFIFEFFIIASMDHSVRVDRYCLGVVKNEQLQLRLCDHEFTRQEWTYQVLDLKYNTYYIDIIKHKICFLTLGNL